MANFIAGRFTSEAKGFRPNNGITFNLLLYGGKPPEPYRTWREVEAVNIQRGDAKDSTELVSTDQILARIARSSLASLVTATGRNDAIRALAWVNANLPGTNVAGVQRDPAWNIVPMTGIAPAGH